MLLLAASLFFGTPEPVEMPRADAFFVKDPGGAMRLEDRYDPGDLWLSRATLGRWRDADGRDFYVAQLAAVGAKWVDSRRTRADYVDHHEILFDAKDKSADSLVAAAVEILSPIAPADDFAPPEQPVRGMREIRYWEGTNESAIVCAFLPEECPFWYFASWRLVPGDDRAYCRELFERDFLGRWRELVDSTLVSERDVFSREARSRPARAGRVRSRSARANALKGPARERELLRDDAIHSVTNYADWHVTGADEFVVLDNLPGSRSFVVEMTNDFSRMRRRYAETVPSPVNGSNVLAVARIFRDRGEYLAAVGEEMAWTAAYWSPQRRELVAHLPEGGGAELLKTLRHEAFHQYLSYACSMIPTSPWFNEGYAQYFEDEESCDWDLGGMEPDIAKAAELLPGILSLDYAEFYDGSDLARRYKYRIAWSIAHFLEKGAPKVRFQPFKDLKRDYVAALLRYRDMKTATAAAFGSREKLELFIAEWKKYWLGDK